jgi:hypothetical protein
VGVYQYPLSPAIPSVAPYARGGQAFAQPVIRLWMIGPRGVERVRTVLDPGAECCLFPEWVAWRVGYRQSPASPVQPMGSSVSRTGFDAWFETVSLELRDPAGVHPPFRWAAPVGFTGRGSFAKSSAYGIIGINGGLDRFRRVEYDWSALSGPEVVIRT